MMIVIRGGKMSVDEKYPLALPVGTILAGQYTIDKVLGQGGFGITYMATDYKTKGKVAVKEFFPDTLAYREVTSVISYPGERSENFEYGKTGFLQEAKTLAEFIGCENIVRIYSYFEENGTAYFVMEYIEGTSFDAYLKQKGGKISCEEAGKILIPIMDALAIVHSKGIVHRDVTPDNIYITNDGTVKLLDFGAARYSLGDKSRSLDVILKHGFAPKEQYTRRGKQGPFTDIYSLGATFYFALTGKRPPDSVERLDEDDLIPPSSLGVQLTEYQEEAILKALNVQPSDRYQSMLDFKAAYLNAETMSKAQPIQTSQPAPTPVVQQFFTAPAQSGTTVQQPNNTGVQPVQAASQSNQSVPQQPNITPNQIEPEKKAPVKSKKIPIIIAAASFAVVCIMAAIVTPIMLNSAKKNNDIVSDSQYEEDEYSSTTISSSDEDSAVPADKPLETAAETTAAAAAEQASSYSADPSIIGNRVGNIGNNGYVSPDGRYWVDDGGHSIKTYNSEGKSECILTADEGQFSCLSMIDDDLFFIYNKSCYVYNISTSKYNAIPELQNYNSDGMRLYVSEGYYFIYEDDQLYRVSRATGETEQSIAVESSVSFTFFEDKLFYLVNDSDASYIIKTSALDFNTIEKSQKYSDAYLSDIVEADGYIYVVCYEITDDIYNVYIDTYGVDFNGRLGYSDITAVCNEIAGKDYAVSYLNVINDMKFICLCTTDSESNFYFNPGLFYVFYDSSSGEMHYEEIASLGSGVWGCSVLKSGEDIELDFIPMTSDSKKLQYKMY